MKSIVFAEWSKKKQPWELPQGRLFKISIVPGNAGVLSNLELIASAAATATVVSTAAAATVEPAAATVSTAAATATVFPWFSFFNNDGATVKFAFVEFGDGFASLFVVGHFHKAKAFGFAGELISDYAGGSDFAKFFEGRT
jgi:hypothetical protein